MQGSPWEGEIDFSGWIGERWGWEHKELGRLGRDGGREYDCKR